MPTGPETQLIADLASGLRGTFLEGELILGGSSGLFGFPTQTPAFTEDPLLVREDLVIARGREVIELLGGLGFQRTPETPTFVSPGRPAFDLVGYSFTDSSDHLSPPAFLQVMVYGDLGIVLGSPVSVHRTPAGTPSLTPAAFCAVKLMTIRVEKGFKDKLQALLVIGERRNESGFTRDLSEILTRFDADRRSDAFADAQAAFLALKQDPEFRDRGAEGYKAMIAGAEAGYLALRAIAEGTHHGCNRHPRRARQEGGEGEACGQGQVALPESHGPALLEVSRCGARGVLGFR
jgi:hypothetical protein